MLRESHLSPHGVEVRWGRSRTWQAATGPPDARERFARTVKALESHAEPATVRLVLAGRITETVRLAGQDE